MQGDKTLVNLKAAVDPCIEAIEEVEKAGQGSVQQLAALEKAKMVSLPSYMHKYDFLLLYA